MSQFEQARNLLDAFKRGKYVYGNGVLSQAGSIAKQVGKKAMLIRGSFSGSDQYVEIIINALKENNVTLTKVEFGAKPNAPLEDLERIKQAIVEAKPDVLISFGGGSTIDAVKAANVLYSIGGNIEDYFGVNKVTEILNQTQKTLLPHIAIQTVASSAAHLTKYSNITDMSTGQKKLIVDEAIVPQYPVFDFSITYKMPKGLTMDGALDGIAHCLEVLYGANNQPFYDKAKEIAQVGISLVVENLPKVINNPQDAEARDALCLATDLGGYAIMVGGTNGGHLTSFSLVDVLSHGRACAIMNPYYTVFFAPAIEDGLKMVGNIFKQYDYSPVNFEGSTGEALGIAVAEAMFALSEKVGFPISLSEVDGFTDEHIERAITAAKNPQLEMKLKNMPMPLTAQTVDEYMLPILQSAKTGDLKLIKQMQVRAND